jgi:hypothetical protein
MLSQENADLVRYNQYNMSKPKTMSRPYMGDIYKFLTEGEGRVIGNLAADKDMLARKVINRYQVHFKDQKCEEAAADLRQAMKEYTARLRILRGMWPVDVPISLRSYLYMALAEQFNEPPG